MLAVGVRRLALRAEPRLLELGDVLVGSAAAQLVSGRDAYIDAGSVINRVSQIAAGRNLTISGRTASDGSDPGNWTGVVSNEALSGYKIIESTGTAHIEYQRCPTGSCYYEPSFTNVDLGSETRRKDVVILGSTITAGQGVNIVGGNISNTVVRAGDGLAAIGPGVGIGLIFAAYINGVARQPEAQSRLQSIAILGFALAEALAIIGIALAFVL